LLLFVGPPNQTAEATRDYQKLPPAEIVYGVRAIGKVINEPNDRRTNYLLERGYIAGAWKAGRGWALSCFQESCRAGFRRRLNPPKKPRRKCRGFSRFEAPRRVRSIAGDESKQK
jgi:hypothetical protein